MESFLSPRIEIFEHDGSRLVAKLSNVHVKEDQMNVADQNRLRQIEAVTEYGLIDQQIPEIDYTATFQVSDAHDGNYLRSDTAVKDKIVAGEIGIAIDKITNEAAKRRVIQHLYNACASIGIGLGLTGSERQLAEGQSHQVGNIRADFVGGIHAKVY